MLTSKIGYWWALTEELAIPPIVLCSPYCRVGLSQTYCIMLGPTWPNPTRPVPTQPNPARPNRTRPNPFYPPHWGHCRDGAERAGDMWSQAQRARVWTLTAFLVQLVKQLQQLRVHAVDGLEEGEHGGVVGDAAATHVIALHAVHKGHHRVLQRLQELLVVLLRLAVLVLLLNRTESREHIQPQSHTAGELALRPDLPMVNKV